jgi:hypothetical protein
MPGVDHRVARDVIARSLWLDALLAIGSRRNLRPGSDGVPGWTRDNDVRRAHLHHISNAGRCCQNEGLNSIIGIAGLSYFLDPSSL